MVSLDQRNALGGRDDADHLDAAGAGGLEQIQRGDRAAARRQHGVNHQDVAVAQPRRQLRIVLERDSGRLVALQTDVAHPRAGHEFEDGIQHPQAGPQYRHDDHVGRHPLTGRSAQWRDHRGWPDRQHAQGLGREKHADPDGHPPEIFRGGPHVAKRKENVLNQWMLNEMNGHRETIHEAGRAFQIG
jgi:hypothetical protein